MNEIFELSVTEFKIYLESLSVNELTKFMHDMNPAQRKIFLDNLSNDEIKYFRDQLPKKEKERFMDKIGRDGVRNYWDRERELVLQGKGTRDWNKEQQKQIISGGKPQFINKNGNVESFEGHHMYSKEEYPKYAASGENIQALTKTEEHIRGAHSGDTKVPTKGYYDEITGEMFDFTSGKVDKGYPPVIDLTELADGITPIDRKNFSEIIPFYDDLTAAQQIEIRRIEYVWRESGQNAVEPDLYKYIIKNDLNAIESADKFSKTVSNNIITDADDKLNILDNVRVDIDNNGKVKGIDVNNKNIPIDNYPYSISASEYKTIDRISDADMRLKYPEFDSMTDMEKFTIKAKDNLYIKNADRFKNIDIPENELLDYARKLGKSNALDLTEDEIMLYKAGKLMSTADDVPLGLVDDVSKYKKLSKISDSVNISGLDVFFLVIDAGFVLQDVNRSIWNIGGQINN